MNERELNKKLAEWAGLIEFTDKQGSVYSYGTKLHKDPPDFTQSLDACFKWLVPKVEDPSISLYKPVLGGNYWVCVLGKKGYIDDVNATGKTPALALCLAIKKLINSEVKE